MEPIADRTVAPTAVYQEALVAVTVNGVAAAEPVVLLRGPGNALYATGLQLRAWRITPPGAAFTRDGIDYYLLTAIEGVDVALDEATQTLSLSARPDLLAPTRLAYRGRGGGEELLAGTGGFINYDVSGQIDKSNSSVGAAFEAGIFTPLGVGLTSFVGNLSRGNAELTRLETNWTIDSPARMRSIRIGDAVSRGGVGGAPLRFAGIQFARNFGVQPGFVSIPLPALRGSAALPSVVDVYVDGVSRGARDIPPGPFEITDIPIVSGNGDVQLVVRDLLGRETLYSQAYYATPALLSAGLHDFSYEMGFVRRFFGLKSNDYGALIASGTHRYGLSDDLTAEVHAEVSRKAQLAGLGSSLAIANLGLAELSAAASRSDRGVGASAGLGLERRSRSLSLGVRAQYTSARYRALDPSDGRRPPASLIQAFAAIPTRFGSFGLSYLRRDGRDEPDAEYVSASSSLRLGRLGSLHLAARKSLAGAREFGGDLSFSMRLGRSLNGNAGAHLDRRGTTIRGALQKNVPVGNGLGYRVAASTGARDRLDGRLSLQSDVGSHEALLSWADGQGGLRLSTSGGFGLVGGSAFAARRLEQSFAKVRVGPYPKVRVYADNQLIGRTDSKGSLIVPRLRPFDQNRLRIELADLPWDAEVSGDERVVRPFDRHGVLIDFGAKPARDGLIRILLANGMPLPAGAVVRVGNGASEFVAAPGGEVYLTGLEASNRVVATWSGGRCAFELGYAEPAQPQPRLGDFQCRPVAR